VVKSQAIDITEIILSRIRRPNAVPTLCRNGISRFEQLSTSETHWSTTKSDGMWKICGHQMDTKIRLDGELKLNRSTSPATKN
jgi:hypothetical protein